MGTDLLSDKIQQIKQDHSNGASQIARNALNVLKSFVQTNKTKTCNDFKTEFRKVGRQLFEAKSNMAPVQNLVAQAVYEVLAKTNAILFPFAGLRYPLLTSCINNHSLQSKNRHKRRHNNQKRWSCPHAVSVQQSVKPSKPPKNKENTSKYLLQNQKLAKQAMAKQRNSFSNQKKFPHQFLLMPK